MAAFKSLLFFGMFLAPSILATPLSNKRYDWYNQPVSCSAKSVPGLANNAAVDACLINSAGGAFLSTQFWNTKNHSAPSDSFGLHGLWPDNCDGTYEAFCSPSREINNVTAVLTSLGHPWLVKFMSTYWVDSAGNHSDFYAHEYNKYGTCISTLEPACYGKDYYLGIDVVQYFQKAVHLFTQLPTFDWLAEANIWPSYEKTYNLADFQEVALVNFGFEAVWGCTNGTLDQVWYAYHTQGSVSKGRWIPTAPLSNSSCPQTGIKYLPKNNIA